MRIVITGVEGFVGKNLVARLREQQFNDVIGIGRSATLADLATAVAKADFVFHLAGANRPTHSDDFQRDNVGLTRALCAALVSAERNIPIVYTSSTQATLDNPYGVSKRGAEEELLAFSRLTGSSVHIFRLTNVFGKWSRPNYNSAVATFCHNVARGLPITINDRSAPLCLVYIDDVIDAFLQVLNAPTCDASREVGPVYETTVGAVADAIVSFAEGRQSLMSGPVGVGLHRALHATYLSFLPPESFEYAVPLHVDPRGEFVEMLKTGDSGQFSYFTAHPGVTRGEHYHHTKTEKFLVIRGNAHFGFRNVVTNETYEITTRGGEGRIVETAPGWAHNITNVGADELIVMLWANEVFDRAKPDTFAQKVDL